MKFFAALIVVCVWMLPLAPTPTTHAAANFSISLNTADGLPCRTTTWSLSIAVTGTVNDPGGAMDLGGVLIFDDLNTPIYASQFGIMAGGSFALDQTSFGPSRWMNLPRGTTITAVIFDITDIPAGLTSNTQPLFDALMQRYATTTYSVSDTLTCTQPSQPPQPPQPTPTVLLPGCGVALPETAVVGEFLSDTRLLWAANVEAETLANVPMITADKTAWVLGVDESGEFYQIAWECQKFWVSVASMGPNYDNVWHGAPLPTNIIP
jgi:hypothetical protein